MRGARLFLIVVAEMRGRAIVIGLALRELVSNVRLYGALSGAQGRVELDWAMGTPKDGAAQLVVTWRGSGGPAVAQPETAGIGRATFERRLPSEIGAEASLTFAPDGAEATIALPLLGNGGAGSLTPLR